MNTVETYQYNNRMQPVLIELGSASNAAANYCLVYDCYGTHPPSCAIPAQAASGSNGNVMGYAHLDNQTAFSPNLGHAATYAYDSLNRLSNAQASGSVSYDLPFSYSANGSDGRYGNVTCVINGNTSGLCPAYNFNSANNQITNSGFTYDAAGNLLSDGERRYRYDAENRIACVDPAPSTWQCTSTSIDYVYNTFGQRVAENQNGAELEGYWNDVAGRRIVTRNGGGWNNLSEEIYAGDRHLAI